MANRTRKTAKERLADRLAAMGIVVLPQDIDVPRGYWSHETQDVLKWTVLDVILPGKLLPKKIGSWDSVETCVRRDRRLVLSECSRTMSGEYEIHAVKVGE